MLNKTNNHRLILEGQLSVNQIQSRGLIQDKTSDFRTVFPILNSNYEEKTCFLGFNFMLKPDSHSNGYFKFIRNQS